MKRSLQRRLSLELGSTILLASLIAAMVSFWLAYTEAKEFQDDMLRQIAVLSVGSSASSINTEAPIASDEALSDPESRVTVIHLPSESRPVWLDSNISLGFHTVDAAGLESFRVFVYRSQSGDHTAVFQPTDARNEIAINNALHTLIPLLLLLPLMGWLIVRIVRNDFLPITLLARSLDEQSVDRLQPLKDEEVPSEITPFIHAINRLLERTNQLIAQQKRFIADAAHELRSPLTALSVQAQNLQQAASLRIAQERGVALQAGIERTKQLTEQLLTLAGTQIETKQDNVISLATMARTLIAEYAPMAEAKNIDLGLEEIASFPIHASFDTLWLILKNALENALKYTATGGEVTLRLLVIDGDAVIEIVDNGPGIPSSEHKRVFDAFYRMPDTQGEGSGLGLVIAREAATRLGGVVSLHNRHGCSGLIFRYKQRAKVNL
jgi:two-component system, OmpR family, sensor kinase